MTPIAVCFILPVSPPPAGSARMRAFSTMWRSTRPTTALPNRDGQKMDRRNPGRLSIRHQASPRFLAKPGQRGQTGGKARPARLHPGTARTSRGGSKARRFSTVASRALHPGKHSLTELDALVERLRPFPLAVELRDPAWVKGPERARTLAAFRQRGIAWVAVDMPKGKEFMPAIDEATRPDLALPAPPRPQSRRLSQRQDGGRAASLSLPGRSAPPDRGANSCLGPKGEGRSRRRE